MITARRVRVTGAEGEALGIISLDEAKQIAYAADLDLVEISPTAFPAYPSSEAGTRSLEKRNLKTKEERHEITKQKLEATIKLLEI